MIKVIGTENCSKCMITKALLINKGIEFDYVYISNLPQSEQDKYMKMAEDAMIQSFPIIIKDEKVITLQEV